MNKTSFIISFLLTIAVKFVMFYLLYNDFVGIHQACLESRITGQPVSIELHRVIEMFIEFWILWKATVKLDLGK